MHKLSLLFLLSLTAGIPAMEVNKGHPERQPEQPPVRQREEVVGDYIISYDDPTEEEIYQINVRANGTTDKTKWVTELMSPGQFCRDMESRFAAHQPTLNQSVDRKIQEKNISFNERINSLRATVTKRWGSDRYLEVKKLWLQEGLQKLREQVQNSDKDGVYYHGQHLDAVFSKTELKVICFLKKNIIAPFSDPECSMEELEAMVDNQEELK